MKIVCNGYIICTKEDLNRWVRDKMKVRITGAFGVPRENNYGRSGFHFCVERGLCVGNSNFKHKFAYIHGWLEAKMKWR